MKRLFLALMLLAGSCLIGYAQDAKTVLEKCAASVSAKSGVQAEFSMNSAQYGNSSGKISVKGKMFTATTSMATLWFDGKTLWTYMSNNDEVNHKKTAWSIVFLWFIIPILATLSREI